MSEISEEQQNIIEKVETKKKLNISEISEEQQDIIETLATNNVYADSVAGSGKTTTCLYIAQHYPDKQILLLTYSAALKEESRKKCKEKDLQNLHCHSYHSFAVQYYNKNCFTDTNLRKLITSLKNNYKLFGYDIIIFDEGQDINELYFSFMCKLLSNNSNKTTCKILVLGDIHQTINQFNGADCRYLLYAEKDQYFKQHSNYSWEKRKLSKTFRMTNQTVDFVNYCMLGQQRLIPHSSRYVTNQKPIYTKCDAYTYPFDLIKEIFNKGIETKDIMILAPSVKPKGKGETPIKELENMIKKQFPEKLIYVSSSDEEKIDNEVIKNKLVFLTYNQSKGLERKHVIVFGFDQSYFEFYNTSANRNICPNVHYVAVTRAIDQLYLIHDFRKEQLPYLNNKLLSTYSEVHEKRKNQLKTIKHKLDIKNVSPSQITSHLPEQFLSSIEILIKTNYLTTEKSVIKLQQRIQFKNSKEQVSDINGIALVLMFQEDLIKKQHNQQQVVYNQPLLTMIHDRMKYNNFLLNFNELEKNKILQTLQNITSKEQKQQCLSSTDVLFLANIYSSIENGYHFRLYQISHYNWLNNDDVTLAKKHLDTLHIDPNNHEFEKRVSHTIVVLGIAYRINGFIDCYDATSNTIYEFKCVSSITIDHILQLLFYGYVMMKEYQQEYHLVLFNIQNNEKIEITNSFTEIEDIVIKVITQKYKINSTQSDEEFIKSTNDIQTKLFHCNSISTKNIIHKLFHESNSTKNDIEKSLNTWKPIEIKKKNVIKLPEIQTEKDFTIYHDKREKRVKIKNNSNKRIKSFRYTNEGLKAILSKIYEMYGKSEINFKNFQIPESDEPY